MSEITEIKNTVLYGTKIINMPMFFVALVFAPILFTLVTFPLLFIPVFALVLGGPIYLVVGFPILLWHLSRKECVPHEIAQIAFATVVIPYVFIVALCWPLGRTDVIENSLGLFFCASVFAPLWGASFGAFYNFLCKPKQDNPLVSNR